MSYNGNVDIGLIADYDAIADLDDLGDDVRDSLAELLDAARSAKPATPRVPAGAESGPST